MEAMDKLYGQIDAISQSLSMLQTPISRKELWRARQNVSKIMASCPPEHRHGLSFAAQLALAVSHVDEATPKLVGGGQLRQGDGKRVNSRRRELVQGEMLARATQLGDAVAPRPFFLTRA